MRQIVQLIKPIVQPANAALTSAEKADANAGTKIMLGLAGKADAYRWDGADQTIEWSLSEGFGYLLVCEGELAATCATGKQARLKKGDLLIMNEANLATFTMALVAGGQPTTRMCAPTTIGPINASDASDTIRHLVPNVVYGSMRANSTPWRAQPFAQAPTWAMAVLRPTAPEYARLTLLAQLLHSENNANESATQVVAGLQATLFEALSVTLRAHDPLSMPQLTAGIDARLSRALTAMAIDPSKPWRIETMAQQAAMSRTAFAVRFKAVMQQTPLDYLTTLRIQHAVTQFANFPNRRIDAIARDVGYADESALRRAYLRVTGEVLSVR